MDIAGNIYITGRLNASEKEGGLLIKYDSAGNQIWKKQFGVFEIPSGLVSDSSNNIYIAGQSILVTSYNSSGGIESTTGWGMSLRKYDSDGNLQWDKFIVPSTAATSSGGTDIAIDSASNLYVTGFSSGSFDGNSNLGGSDNILVKYNSAGTKLWSRQFGTNKDEEGPQKIAIDSSDNIFITGKTKGALDGNTSDGSEDIFLMKYNTSGDKL